jgi:hypothetical protein
MKILIMPLSNVSKGVLLSRVTFRVCKALNEILGLRSGWALRLEKVYSLILNVTNDKQTSRPRISLNIQRFTDSECDPGEKKALEALAGAMVRISIKPPERKVLQVLKRCEVVLFTPCKVLYPDANDLMP